MSYFDRHGANSRLAPFLLHANKLYVTTRSHHKRYLDAVTSQVGGAGGCGLAPRGLPRLLPCTCTMRTVMLIIPVLHQPRTQRSPRMCTDSLLLIDACRRSGGTPAAPLLPAPAFALR